MASTNVHFLAAVTPSPKYKSTKISTPSELNHEQALLDIKSLTRTALKGKYKLTYDSWKNMKSRSKAGAIISQEFSDFGDFLRHMGPKKSVEYTIDRIDCFNPTYGPGLCRWADKHTQNQNKTNNVFLTYMGERLTVSAWAAKTDQPADTLYKRRQAGWSDSEIITGSRQSNSHHVRVSTSPWPRKHAADWEASYKRHRQPDESKLGYLLRKATEQLDRCKDQYGEMLILAPEVAKQIEVLQSIRRDAYSRINGARLRV